MWPFVFSAITKAASAGITFSEQRREGAAALKQGDMTRALYGKNADLAESQAVDAEARGQEASNRQTYKMRTTLGSQNSAFAAQGVSLANGSPAAVINSDQSLGEADRLNILENARREASGFRQQAGIYRDQGNLAYTAGANKQKELNMESLGTLVNFGGDMLSMYKGAGGISGIMGT